MKANKAIDAVRQFNNKCGSGKLRAIVTFDDYGEPEIRISGSCGVVGYGLNDILETVGRVGFEANGDEIVLFS